MTIWGVLYAFNDWNISEVPRSNGVYALYDGLETIYIGKAEGIDGIRDRLEAHKDGREGWCTQQATDYRFEFSNNPSSREKELLEEYLKTYGRLPRCNKRIG